ncbi:anther-specific protein LAT52-like [Macadamia integrifolia]|uniref:anther-specific protein LAT52-like n=1 Tax=Macadamia integrifolia TaxID=60698 RepID=UPI001C4F4536|nr:anther-specific protein LAT52-like [Macadamia integrifolia]
MAKVSQALLIAAVCFFGLLGFAYCHEDFEVVGKVYCDTCRALFETEASIFMKGAPVKLECRNRDTGNITYTVEGVCDESGSYRLIGKGEHAEDICEVTALNSTVPDCDERAPGRDHARIVLTDNNGIVSNTRYANSLGFLKKEPLEICPEVLQKAGLIPSITIGQ